MYSAPPRAYKHFLDIQAPFQYRFSPVPFASFAFVQDTGRYDENEKFVGDDTPVDQYKTVVSEPMILNVPMAINYGGGDSVIASLICVRRDER